MIRSLLIHLQERFSFSLARARLPVTSVDEREKRKSSEVAHDPAHFLKNSFSVFSTCQIIDVANDEINCHN